MPNETALITGASSGIGFDLAREFARHKHPLILVAPDNAELKEVAADIRYEFGVRVTTVAADLTDPEAPQQIFDAVREKSLGVQILVNNAGIGHRGKFREIPLEKDLEMLRLNVEAVIRLTKFFLPPMVARDQGIILNTASVAAFEPGPTMAVYHATQAFVLSWSEALATELEDTGVTVTALCPGTVDTDFFPKAGLVESVAFQKAMMASQEVARAGHEGAMKGVRVIVPGGLNKVTVTSRHLIGGSRQAKENDKAYFEGEPEDHKRGPGEVSEKAAAKED